MIKHIGMNFTNIFTARQAGIINTKYENAMPICI